MGTEVTTINAYVRIYSVCFDAGFVGFDDKISKTQRYWPEKDAIC